MISFIAALEKNKDKMDFKGKHVKKNFVSNRNFKIDCIAAKTTLFLLFNNIYMYIKC